MTLAPGADGLNTLPRNHAQQPGDYKHYLATFGS